MQRAMAAEAEAIREAKAKIVAAEGELNASKALKEASDVMSTNPITLQVFYYNLELLLFLIRICFYSNSCVIYKLWQLFRVKRIPQLFFPFP